MTYEEVIERVRQVPQERLEELDGYIVRWVKQCAEVAGTEDDRQADTEQKRAQKRHKAYETLMQYAGIIKGDFDYEEELQRIREERYARYKSLD